MATAVSNVCESAATTRQCNVRCRCGIECDQMSDVDEQRRSPLRDIIESPTRSPRREGDDQVKRSQDEAVATAAGQHELRKEASPLPDLARSTPGKEPPSSWKTILAEAPAEDSTCAVDVLPNNGSFTTLRMKESELNEQMQKIEDSLRDARRQLRESEADMAWLRDENARLRSENEQLRSERVPSALNSSSHGVASGAHVLAYSEGDRVLGGRTASEQLDALLSERTLLKSQLSEAQYHLATMREDAAMQAHELATLRARNAELDAEVEERRRGGSADSDDVAAVMREKEASRAASARYHAQLRALDKKLKSLERYSAQLREEKEELERQAQRAHLDLIDIEKKMQNRVVVDIREIHQKNLELATVEERLTAAQLGLARALRIIANSKEMGHLVSYDEAAGQFAFVGWNLVDATGGDDAETCSADSGEDEDGIGISHHHGKRRQRHDVRTRRNRENYASAWVLARGGGGGLSTGTDGGVYSGLTSQQESKNVKLSGKDEHTLRVLKRAVDEENRFLRARKVRLSDLLPPGMGDGVNYTGANVVDRVVKKGDDVLHCRQQESDYWIPYAAFVAAQQFKNLVFPKLPISTFYPFLIQLNRVWHERMQQRLRTDAARRTTPQRVPPPPRRHQETANGDNDVRVPVSSAAAPGNGSLPGCVELREQVDAVLREIRLRVHEKTALYLFRLLEKVVKNTLHAYAILEERPGNTTATTTRKFPADGPGTTAATTATTPASANEQPAAITSILSFLQKVSETLRTVSLHSSHAILTACDELRAFLHPLYTGLGGADAPTVPTETVAQLMESVLDFMEDVRQEVVHSTDSLCRVADAADKKALDASMSDGK